jgi:hypothetical protein
MCQPHSERPGMNRRKFHWNWALYWRPYISGIEFKCHQYLCIVCIPPFALAYCFIIMWIYLLTWHRTWIHKKIYNSQTIKEWRRAIRHLSWFSYVN